MALHNRNLHLDASATSTATPLAAAFDQHSPLSATATASNDFRSSSTCSAISYRCVHLCNTYTLSPDGFDGVIYMTWEKCPTLACPFVGGAGRGALFAIALYRQGICPLVALDGNLPQP